MKAILAIVVTVCFWARAGETVPPELKEARAKCRAAVQDRRALENQITALKARISFAENNERALKVKAGELADAWKISNHRLADFSTQEAKIKADRAKEEGIINDAKHEIFKVERKLHEAEKIEKAAKKTLAEVEKDHPGPPEPEEPKAAITVFLKDETKIEAANVVEADDQYVVKDAKGKMQTIPKKNVDHIERAEPNKAAAQ